MSVASETPARVPTGDRRTQPANPWIAAGVAVAIAAGVVLRFVSTSELWLDEALTVHIAQLPWDELEPALRQDGAPPLFFALLHLWMDVFGSSNVAVRALPGVISVATLPLAYLAGRRIGGTRLAWISVLLFAVSPYAIRYATETRMYSLETFLVLAGYLVLMRALECPTIVRLAPVAIATALLLYNQYWSPYLLAVVGAGLVATAVGATPSVRQVSRRVLGAMVIGGLAFVPWLPTLRYQLSHTGTPWGEVYLPPAGFGLTAIDFAGARFAFGWVLAGLVVVLPLLGVFGRAVDDRRIELDVRTVPDVRWIAAAGAATLVVGLSAAYVSSTTYEGRYGAVVFGLFVLVAARGVTVFADARVRTGLLVIAVVLGLGVGAQHGAEARTQADEAAAAIHEHATSEDVVVYCPDQLGPGMARLLDGQELDQVTFPDLDPPELVNWVDYADRYAGADSNAFVDAIVARAGDRTIWLVTSSGYQHTDGPCGAVELRLSQSRPSVEPFVLQDTDLLEHHTVSRFLP